MSIKPLLDPESLDDKSLNIYANSINVEEADIKTLQIDSVETDNIECLNIDVAENLINGEVTYSKTKGTTAQVLTLVDNDGKTEFKDIPIIPPVNTSLSSIALKVPVTYINTSAVLNLVSNTLPGNYEGDINDAVSLLFNPGESYKFSVSGNFSTSGATSTTIRMSFDGGFTNFNSFIIPNLSIGPGSGYWKYESNFSVKSGNITTITFNQESTFSWVDTNNSDVLYTRTVATDLTQVTNTSPNIILSNEFGNATSTIRVYACSFIRTY